MRRMRDEPGQVRKEAALSFSVRVPRVCQVGAIGANTARSALVNGGLHGFFRSQITMRNLGPYDFRRLRIVLVVCLLVAVACLLIHPVFLFVLAPLLVVIPAFCLFAWWRFRFEGVVVESWKELASGEESPQSDSKQ